MCKLDLKGTYFSVPLNPASRKFVWFLWSGKLSSFFAFFFRYDLVPTIIYFYEITQNSSFSTESTEHKTNYNLLGGHVVYRSYNWRNVMASDTVIFLLQQLGFVINLKKSIWHLQRE